jgi:hypothetical protein
MLAIFVMWLQAIPRNLQKAALLQQSWLLLYLPHPRWNNNLHRYFQPDLCKISNCHIQQKISFSTIKWTNKNLQVILFTLFLCRWPIKCHFRSLHFSKIWKGKKKCTTYVKTNEWVGHKNVVQYKTWNTMNKRNPLMDLPPFLTQL